MTTARLVQVVLFLLPTWGLASAQPGRSRGRDISSKVVKETVTSTNHSWVRLTGKVKVINASTIRFEDGAEYDLHQAIDIPEPAQMGRIDGKLYPCGKEAAEFLTKLIGDKPVALYVDRNADLTRSPSGKCYVGETHVQQEMVWNGWAVSRHSGMDAWEVIARENKRGMWRGEFVVPEEWRKGKRLPLEEAARKQANEQKPGDKPPAIVGAWDVTSYHTTQAGLFQLVWGARRREASVRFELSGDRLTGHVVSTERGGVKGEPIVFRTLQFSGNRLVFEFDIKGWEPGFGPIAVESGRLPNKGMLRAEARLTGDRLVGTWGLFTSDGAEVYRGEWEAVRSKAAEKK